MKSPQSTAELAQQFRCSWLRVEIEASKLGYGLPPPHEPIPSDVLIRLIPKLNQPERPRQTINWGEVQTASTWRPVGSSHALPRKRDFTEDGAISMTSRHISPLPTESRVFRDQHAVLIGHGPRTATEMHQALTHARCEIAEPGDPNAGVLIIGREGWLVDDIEGQIKARRGSVLRIYSQELALRALEDGRDPLATVSERGLRALADGHPALEFCRDEGFDWPNIDTARIASELEYVWDEGAGESPLHMIGYHVGKTSALSERQRRKILRRAFGDELPFVNCEQYMKRWGTPESRRRLRRLATHLRWNIGSARARTANMTVAIRDWESDLAWMESSLYQRWMRFRWPSTSVSL